MQLQKIVLIPPSDEQASASFHVEASLLEAFLRHLEASGIETLEPPEPLGHLGPQGKDLFEIEIKEEHSFEQLEPVLEEFLKKNKISN